MLASRDKRPAVSPRALLAALSAFSRAESAVHRGGGSGRARSRAGGGSLSEALEKSLRPGSRRSLPGNSRDLSPGLSSRLESGRRGSLLSLASLLSLPSLPSLRSPCRGGWCLSSIRWEGIGASGRLGRLLDRSGKVLGVTFREDSERPVTLADVAAAFASLSRRCCSLLARTSDLRGSATVGAAGVNGLGSVVVSTGVAGLAVLAFATVVEVLASSTSPSSTSAVVGGFGVDTPREL